MTVLLKMSDDPAPRPRRRRRRRLRYIAVLPTLLTLGNLVCGFSAVYFGLRAMFAAGAGIPASMDATLDSQVMERMLPSFLAIGAMLIFLGMVFDMLDGLAARLADNASAFGAQIDSLADVVSFGVAPPMLVIAMIMRELNAEVVVGPLSAHAMGRAIWVCSAAYCICAAVRLARFNVEHARADHSHRTFHGLPSPGAAAGVASLIMLHEHAGAGFSALLIWVLPLVTLGSGFLMISRIRYERITQAYLVKRRPFEHIIAFLVVFVVFWSYKAPTLAVLCCAYAMSGPAIHMVRRFRGGLRASDDSEATQTPSEIPVDGETRSG